MWSLGSRQAAFSPFSECIVMPFHNSMSWWTYCFSVWNVYSYLFAQQTQLILQYPETEISLVKPYPIPLRRINCYTYQHPLTLHFYFMNLLNMLLCYATLCYIMLCYVCLFIRSQQTPISWRQERYVYFYLTFVTLASSTHLSSTGYVHIYLFIHKHLSFYMR